MSTTWTITADAEQVVLDDRREGEAVFTVTNPGPAADRVVFEVVPDEGADASWFSVAEPQRLVRGGESVSYPVKVVVPAEVAPGTYHMQGLVYSADLAPEETSVLSPQVVLEVPAGEVKPSRRWPWWWFAVAGLVVVVLVVVIALVATRGEEVPPSAQPTPTATAPPVSAQLGVMPAVVGLTEAEALHALAVRGIVLRSIQYQYNPEQEGVVVSQRVEAGQVVDPERGVTLVVGTDLPAPVLTGPLGVVQPPASEGLEFTWDLGESKAEAWVVTVRPEQCTLEFSDEMDLGYDSLDLPYGLSSVKSKVQCQFTAPRIGRALDDPSIELRVPQPDDIVEIPGVHHTGWYEWYVEAVDSFGNRGPRSEPGYFLIRRGG